MTARLSASGVSLVIGILVSVALGAYLFSSVSLEEVTSLIDHADRRIVGAFLVASLLASFFRTWRYRLMLRCLGFETPFPAMFLVVLVRNTFSDLLPARIGTLIYVFLIRTRLGIPLSAGGATFALAFLLDIIAIVPLIITCVFLSSTEAPLSAGVLLGGALLLAIIVILLFFALPKALALLGSDRMDFRIIPQKHRAKVADRLSETAGRIREIEHAGIWGRLLCLSVLIRFGKYLGLYLFLYALLSPQGFTLESLPFPTVFFGLCAAEFAASVPFLAGLGGFGAYQGAWITTFSLLGFPLELAKITSLGHHLFTQAYGYGIGAAALALLSLPLYMRRGTVNRSSLPEHPFRFGVKCMFSLGVAGLLALGCLTYL